MITRAATKRSIALVALPFTFTFESCVTLTIITSITVIVNKFFVDEDRGGGEGNEGGAMHSVRAREVGSRKLSEDACEIEWRSIGRCGPSLIVRQNSTPRGAASKPSLTSASCQAPILNVKFDF